MEGTVREQRHSRPPGCFSWAMGRMMRRSKPDLDRFGQVSHAGGALADGALNMYGTSETIGGKQRAKKRPFASRTCAQASGHDASVAHAPSGPLFT